ncbi:hypothetical protein ACIA5H_30070 [Nocardia sp. NPDC051900]|uniref:hypothetical protein n=1 Tax=Nocardia sp. NPDC051900 TaxID=3364326 RepID=UPI00378A8679
MTAPAGQAPEPSRWTTAAAETRTAAKWLIGSLAAAGALIFGAGPIVTKPQLSWSNNMWQLLIAMIAGTAGLVALIMLIGSIARVLAPIRVTLTSLPPDLQETIDKADLPSKSKNYADFVKNYQRYKQIEADLSARLDHCSGLERTQTETLLADARHNVEVYKRAANGYLERAEYHEANRLFSRSRKLVLGLAVVAAIGALGFQLSLTTAPKSDTSEKSQLAYIIEPRQSDQLWDQLDLAACATAGKVPVMLSGGTGTISAPYKVTVITATDHCTAKSFDLAGSSLTVEKPEPARIEIKYR